MFSLYTIVILFVVIELLHYSIFQIFGLNEHYYTNQNLKNRENRSLRNLHYDSRLGLGQGESTPARSHEKKIPFLDGDVVLRQVIRETALNLMKLAKEKGETIIDFGGATAGHMWYADTVADYHNHTKWYQQNAPNTRFIPNVNIAKPLPFENQTFDWVWTSHVAEHVPNPELFCDEINRIARIGGVICVPTPFSDNLLSPKHGNPGSLDHVWWWMPHPTDPNKIGYTKAIRVMNAHANVRAKNNLMRNWFPSSWESCFIYRTPLNCNKLPQRAVDWSKSLNQLPLEMTGPPPHGVNLY